MSALTEARAAVGGLSRAEKMPCMAYSTPAQACNVGSRLRKISGSVCSDCYALKGRYMFPNVQNALTRRLESIDRPDWAALMATAINGAEYFRWHDSGDLQSMSHLEKIVEVCKATPNTRHWLPTREKKIIKQYLRSNAFPPNLTVRLSAPMIDGDPPVAPVPTSTVHKSAPAKGYACPAPSQGNKCRDCRACWDSSIDNVSYHAH